jgi:hypothetical protein
MTKQLALDQVARQGGTVYGDKGPFAAPAALMDGARRQLLAGSTFTDEKYRSGRTVGRGLELTEQPLHRLALANQRRKVPRQRAGFLAARQVAQPQRRVGGLAGKVGARQHDDATVAELVENLEHPRRQLTARHHWTEHRGHALLEQVQRRDNLGKRHPALAHRKAERPHLRREIVHVTVG